MSFLDKMRSGSDSTLVQLMLAAVFVSFVFWGFGNQGQNTGTFVASVNGTQIPDVELNREYRKYEFQRESGLGRALSDAESAALRDEVRNRLVEQEVLRQEAVRLGLQISDTELARALLAIPAFRNEQGKFDKKLYANSLKRQGYTQGDYEAELRRQLLRDKLRGLAFLGADVSEPELKKAWKDASTTLDVSYVRVAPMHLSDDVDTSSEAVATFLAENKERVEETYKADFERLYNQPEKVTLSMIRLPAREDGVTVDQLKERLEAVRGQIAQGADFAELARKWSEHPSAAKGGKLEQQALSLLDEAAGTAVQGLQPGQISEVLAGSDEVRLIRLEERIPARVIPLEEAQADIAKTLMRQEQGPRLAAKFAEDVLAKWKDAGAPPTELLDAQGLSVQQTGPVPAMGGAQPFGPPPDLLQAAAAAEEGAVLPKVFEADGVYWVGQLGDRQEPDEAAYEADKAEIREQVLLVRRAQFYDAWLDGLVAEADVTY